MSFLSGQNIDSTAAVEADVLGGRRPLLSSDVYDCIIKLAYIVKSNSSKAVGVKLVLDHNGSEVSDTFWFLNSKGEYKTVKDGVEKFVYGYQQMESVCLLSIGQNFQKVEAAQETRTIKVYNFEQKQEVNTDVQMLMPLVGKAIKAGILERKENKTKKNDQTGLYENLTDSRQFNTAVRFFRPRDSLTVAEILAKVTEPKFYKTWLQANQGKLDDKYKEVKADNGNAGAPAGNFAGAGTNTSASAAPTDNPFM